MTEIAPDPIMRIALGFMAAKHLFVAAEIGVFEQLASGPLTLDELAAAAGIPHRTLRISADAMVSLGLLEREDDRYRNSPAAAAFLAGAPGPDLRPMLRFWDKLSYPRWVGLESAVRSGAGQSGFFRFSEEEQQIFSNGVEAFSTPAAVALAVAYDFGRHKRVLDLAGGTGSFLIAATTSPGTRGRGALSELWLLRLLGAQSYDAPRQFLAAARPRLAVERCQGLQPPESARGSLQPLDRNPANVP